MLARDQLQLSSIWEKVTQGQRTAPAGPLVTKTKRKDERKTKPPLRAGAWCEGVVCDSIISLPRSLLQRVLKENM